MGMKRSFGLNAAFDIMRTGKCYRLINFGDTYEFEVLDILDNGDFILKTLDTLEELKLSEIIDYGVSKDFVFDEI